MEFFYRCSLCQRRYTIVPELTLCPECSALQLPDQPLHGILEVELEGTVGSELDIFDLLPVERSYFPPAPVGDTPLWEPLNLRSQLGFEKLYIKDDGSNPTSSFKDRASYLVSAFAKKCGIEEIALASTGNAGSSMAGIGAAAGQKITLFLPKTAPIAKLVQALQYGARVYRVDGSYDQAFQISLEYSRRKGGMNRNTAYNPMTLEGKKTVSLELFKTLGRAPDSVFVAVGDGCILSGVYKGFRDLKQLGFISEIPKVIGVQAENSAAIYRALRTGEFTPEATSTVADSICVDVPSNGLHALTQIQTFNGELMTVSDEEILAAQARLSASTGLFTEPAGAAAFAGFLKAAPGLDRQQTIVVLTTGNGLKDSQSAQRGIHMPQELISSLSDIL
ncbi:MAG: threonine synthase [Desulfuromonadales bacterium]|nr:threonine synthase [Desulfuromonadales bacterium]MBN2793664.1 threonine synthase [Desulfuromonadales bacterium]